MPPKKRVKGGVCWTSGDGAAGELILSASAVYNRSCHLAWVCYPQTSKGASRQQCGGKAALKGVLLSLNPSAGGLESVPTSRP